MKKTSLLIVIFVCGVFSISVGGAQSCPGVASAGEVVCLNSEDCSSGQECTPKNRCINSITVCKTVTGTSVNTGTANQGGTSDPLSSPTGASTANTGQGTTFNASSPGVGFSASDNPLNQFLKMIGDVVKTLTPIMVGLGLLAFFWFLVMFIWKGADNPAERQKGISGMGWSILALFVMVSIWGIISFIGKTVGIQQGGTMHGFVLPGKTN